MKWIRPSGTEIETDDRPETIAYAESLAGRKQNGNTPRKFLNQHLVIQ